MPPSGVVEGIDRVGIVIARLIVDGDDRGLRPFIVMLSANGQMCKGVTSRYALSGYKFDVKVTGILFFTGSFLEDRVQRTSTTH